MKKYQIIRMKNGKQQNYNRETGSFENSIDRWSGQFESTQEEARALFSKIIKSARKTNVCTLPKLSEVI